MTNFILESEQRVGSRWVHYLLADLLGKRPSPEIDGRHLMINHMETRAKISNLFVENRIPKIHHIHVQDLYNALYPIKAFKTITVVRNPRDRAVSVAFHHAFDPGRAQWAQKEIVEKYRYELNCCENEDEKEEVALRRDKELVEFTVRDYDRYFVSNTRMLTNMSNIENASTNDRDPHRRHMWIPYESLKKSPVTEFSRLVEFLGLTGETVMDVADAVELHDFANKAKRKAGEEVRQDVWRRKGIVGDWKNWFTNDLLHLTEPHFTQYNQLLMLAGYNVVE